MVVRGLRGLALAMLGSIVLWGIFPLPSGLATNSPSERPVPVSASEPATTLTAAVNSVVPSPAVSPGASNPVGSPSTAPTPTVSPSSARVHVRQLTAVEISRVEKATKSKVTESREGILRLGIFTRTASYFVTIQDGKLPSGRDVLALSFSKTAPVTRTIRTAAVGLNVAYAAQQGILICSYVVWPDNPVTGVGFYLHICPTDVVWIEVLSAGLVGALMGVAVGSLVGAGIVAAGAGAVAAALAAGVVTIGFQRALNQGSLDIHIQVGQWAPPTGDIVFGTGLVAHVNGNICAITLDTGEVLHPCAYGHIYRWVGLNGNAQLQAFVINVLGDYATINQAAPGWSGYTYLQTGMSSRAAVAMNATGNMDLFGRNGTTLVENFQTSPGALNWHGPQSVFCCVQGTPAIARNADGRLETFVRNTSGEMWHLWQSSIDSSFSGAGALPGPAFAGDASIGANSDGRLEVFATDTNGHVQHAWQNASSPGGWSGWADLGGTWQGTPAVASNADGHLEVFVRGTDNNVYHTWQQPGGPGGWSGWFGLSPGTFASDFVLGMNFGGALEMFGIDFNGTLWHIWQDPSGPGGWTGSGWNNLGCCVGGFADVQSNPDGRLEVFAIGTGGTNGHLVHAWQQPSCGCWQFGDLGGVWLTV
jgi:hypothetical protein